MRVVREPQVYLVGRQVVDEDAVRAFLAVSYTHLTLPTNREV